MHPAGRFAASAALMAALACGGQTFDGRVFENGEMAFQVGRTPGSWRQIDAPDALLAFRDDAAGATIAVNGRCGRDGDDVPLKSLTHHLFLHFTEREIVTEDLVPLDGREALRTELLAELDGVPKQFTVYVLKKDGCVYDFLHVAAVDAPDATREDFTAFVKGFATRSPR